MFSIFKGSLGAGALLLTLASSAGAVTLSLTLDNPGATSYQQTASRPCFIGDSACSSGSLGAKTIVPNDEDYFAESPTYTVGLLRSIVGNRFFVGIDVNSSRNPIATEILGSFSLNINGGLPEFMYLGPAQLKTNGAGAGFSDSLLKGFDLSGFAATDTAVFRTSLFESTAGKERFFLIADPSAVPEPASILLFGTALLSVGAWQRRRATAPPV